MPVVSTADKVEIYIWDSGRIEVYGENGMLSGLYTPRWNHWENLTEDELLKVVAKAKDYLMKQSDCKGET